jgi:uncharacterized DUF497 family protein
VSEITWDDRKKADNPKKHDGVSFDEGQTIFFDPLLLVSFIDYPGRHHILSARKPTSKERKAYEEGI